MARARRPCLAVFHPGPASLAFADYADLALAVAADCDSERQQDVPVVVIVGENRLAQPAGVTLNVGYPAAWSLRLRVFPAFPAQMPPAVQALLASAAHAGLFLAETAAHGLEFAGALVVERMGLVSGRLYRLFAVTVYAGQLGHPAGVVPAGLAKDAVYPAAWNPAFRMLRVFPSGQALFALLSPALDTVAALQGRVAGDGISAFEAHAAAPLAEDTGLPNILADRLVAEQVPRQRCGPICPNRFYAVPNHDPSDLPNVVAHPSATR